MVVRSPRPRLLREELSDLIVYRVIFEFFSATRRVSVAVVARKRRTLTGTSSLRTLQRRGAATAEPPWVAKIDHVSPASILATLCADFCGRVSFPSATMLDTSVGLMTSSANQLLDGSTRKCLVWVRRVAGTSSTKQKHALWCCSRSRCVSTPDQATPGSHKNSTDVDAHNPANLCK